MGVPGQAKPFFLVSSQLDLGARCAGGVHAVLGTVKDQDSAINGECGDDVRVLGLISGLVHFAGVVNLLGDLERDDGRLAATWPASVAAKLPALLVILSRVGLDGLGDLEFGYLDIVGLPLGCVGSDKQPVDCLVLFLQILDVGEPLGRQGGPFERGARLVSRCAARRGLGALT